MTGTVLFGVAGWSYADWRGKVYPRGCKDDLRFLTRFVDLIEINTTFYQVPQRSTVAGWVGRTEARGTVFTAKVPQQITHRGEFDAKLVAAFIDCLEPLLAAGRLRAILAQFSYAFRCGPAALQALRDIAAAFGEFAPLVLEVRDRTWADSAAQRVLHEMGYSIAHLDYPMGANGFDARGSVPRGLGYFRLHGRNRDAWYSKTAGRDEVYDYSYSASERRDLSERLGELAESAARDTLVVANNHFQGQALKLALELRAGWTGQRVDVPDPLLAAYPELREIARGVLF